MDHARKRKAAALLLTHPAKRLRCDSPPRPRQFSRRAPARHVARVGNDIEDMNFVPPPGIEHRPLLQLCPPHKFRSVLSSEHIPTHLPLVNRKSFRELDLNLILRNPQLRHDLLFDAGLQFRPTVSRRKNDIAERYWAAVITELESGCTCVSFDLTGQPRPCVCICDSVGPSSSEKPVVGYSSPTSTLTVRTASRLKPLLAEFLEVLLLVIQPLTNISTLYVDPSAVKPQMDEHAAQAKYIRSVFDPALVEQELLHRVFDPTGLFTILGETLRCHAAPMRDAAIDTCIQRVLKSAPGAGGTASDAVIGIRMLFDVLELMQLDVANHQLHCLRPFLCRSACQFEFYTFLNAFHTDVRRPDSLPRSRKWLEDTHKTLMTSPSLYTQCRLSPLPSSYLDLQRNGRLYVSVLKGLVDLIFYPPSPLPTAPTYLLPTALSKSVSHTFSALPMFPETTFLDNARLSLLAADAADLTTFYMFILLFRQLNLTPVGGPRTHKEISRPQYARFKSEIRDIGGTRPGHALRLPKDGEEERVGEFPGLDAKEISRRRNMMGDMVLQVALHVSHAKASTQRFPDQSLVNLAQRWAAMNAYDDSDFVKLLRVRARDAVFKVVLAMIYPGRSTATATGSRIYSVPEDVFRDIVVGVSPSLEPLLDDIRVIAEKIAKLAVIHLNTYLFLYEQEGFVDLR